MFQAIADAETIQEALKPVGVLVEECKIHLNEDGLAIRAVDPANVGMVDLELAAAAFESYDADGGLLGVNLSRLEDVAGMATAGQLLRMELNEETRKLHLDADGLEYTPASIDPASIRGEPDLPARVVIDGADIDQAVKAADMVSDHVTVGVDDETETVYFDAAGDTDDVHFELDRADVIDLEAADARSIYSLDYLKDLNRRLARDGEVTLNLGEEFPLEVAFEIAEGQGHVTYMLAPRIQSE